MGLGSRGWRLGLGRWSLRGLWRRGRGGLRRFVLVAAGREEVVLVGVDGVADGFAPAVGAEGVDVFVLG